MAHPYSKRRPQQWTLQPCRLSTQLYPLASILMSRFQELHAFIKDKQVDIEPHHLDAVFFSKKLDEFADIIDGVSAADAEDEKAKAKDALVEVILLLFFG